MNMKQKCHYCKVEDTTHDFLGNPRCDRCKSIFERNEKGEKELPKNPQRSSAKVINVRVTDFDMPFDSMIWLMARWAMASIPAGIIAVSVYTFVIMATLNFLELLSGR